jgi:hypothetical protein
VAYVNLVCYYVIGLTVGCVLGFKTSLGVAVSLTILLLILVLYFHKVSAVIMNLIVIFIWYLVGNDPWSFHTDCYTNNSDCQNKLGCRGIQNFWPRQEFICFM